MSAKSEWFRLLEKLTDEELNTLLTGRLVVNGHRYKGSSLSVDGKTVSLRSVDVSLYEKPVEPIAVEPDPVEFDEDPETGEPNPDEDPSIDLLGE